MATFVCGIGRIWAVLFSLVYGATVLAQSATNNPSIESQPADQSVRTGEAATFSVVATGTQPLSYYWRFNGTNLPGANSSTLSLPVVDLRNYGPYTVVVSNSLGRATSAVAWLRVDDHLTFKVLELTTNGVQSADVTTTIGNTKGGLAVSSQNLFVNGRTETRSNPMTARVPLSNLGGGVTLPQGFDGLVYNLRSEAVYALGFGATPLYYTNSTLSSRQITTLLEVDGATGILTGNRINLSSPISLTNYVARNMGIFCGYDRLVLHINNQAYNIDLPSGRVLSLGNMSAPSHRASPAGLGYWGIAEYWQGRISIVHQQDWYRISRTTVPQRSTTAILTLPTYDYYETFTDQMNSIAFSVGRSRWYGHVEGQSIFSRNADGGTENIFTAKAAFTTEPGFPDITREPSSTSAYAETEAILTVTASGTEPLHYQWYFNGTAIPNATTNRLVLQDVGPEAEGEYWVEVGNMYGSQFSRRAYLEVWSAPEFPYTLSDRGAFQGTNIDFYPTVYAAPPVLYQWRFNGVEIPGATNNYLRLTNVQPDQTGFYTLWASNRFGTALSDPVELFVTPVGTDGSVFKITSLLTNSVRVVNTENVMQYWYNYGTFAASASRIFYSGYDWNNGQPVTGHNNLEDLTGGVRTSRGYPGLISNLRTEQVYVLADGNEPIQYDTSANITTLLELNGATGALTGGRITLSTPIWLDTLGYSVGFFSGWGRFVILTGSRAYQVSLPTGIVKDLGPMYTPSYAYPYNGGAFWGIAEYFNGVTYLAFVRDSTTIRRARVPDGQITTLTNFFNLSPYMGAFTVSVPKGRWYFKHQWYTSQFSTNRATLGSAPATFEISSGTRPDRFEVDPIGPLQITGQKVTVTLRAFTSSGVAATNYNGTANLELRPVTGTASLPVTPASVNFTNGIWSGSLTFSSPTVSGVLYVYDREGNVGQSNPFGVSPQNDLVVNMVDEPDPVVVGRPFSYLVTITNTGPTTATAVRLTNTIPAEVFLSEITASPQGACYTSGQGVWCELGDLPGGQVLSVRIDVLAAVQGIVSNYVAVARGEADPLPANNSAATITTIKLPSLSITDTQVVEGDSGTNFIRFDISLAPPSTNTVSVRFSAANDSALYVGSNPDFYLTNGVLVFPPLTTNLSVSVAVRGDILWETNETFFLNLVSPTNAVIEDPQGACLIINDDPMPWLTVYDTGVLEGDTGFLNVPFRMTLSSPCGYPVAVNFTTVPGTATPGSDYNARTGLQTFAAGTMSLSQNILVQVVGDKTSEINETFALQITGVSNAGLSNSTAWCVITNNDGGGQLNHFTWNPIPSIQHTGAPVAVTLTARDVFEEVITNFSGAVSLSAAQGRPQEQYTLLNGTPATNMFSDASYTLAYTVIPNTNIWVTHLRAFTGSKVSLWDDRGTLLASATAENPTNWVDLKLDQAVPLTSGERYRLGFYSDRDFGFIYPAPGNFAHGVLAESYYVTDDVFPTNMIGSDYIYLTDLAYVVGPPSVPVLMTPTNTSNFTQGVWSGSITLMEPGTNVLLTAWTTNGIMGFSNPINVLPEGSGGDTDGDGLPDEWEIANGLDAGNPNDGQLDADNDRFSNLSEYLAGTDPRSATSLLRIGGLQIQGTEVRVAFQPVTGKTYYLERAATVPSGTWTVVRSFTANDSQAVTLIDSGSQTNQAFYRIRLGQ